MIAYRLLRAGKHEARVRKGREWLPIETGVVGDDGKEIIIKSGEIWSYMDEYFYTALDLYNNTELFGSLPFSGGWAEQPYPVYRVLQILKSESNRWESMEIEKQRHGKKRNP